MSDCFAPGEQPPPCRLYMIAKGTAEFRDVIRTSPFCWGALDVNGRHSNLGPTDLQIDEPRVRLVLGQVMLPNAGSHIDLVATSTSYLVSRSYTVPSPAMCL